ncbi:S-adenosyl-L-methionine-dependent methyltransferase [Auriscalpium vulgare]|uniref:S-adenosyl-L-methionine-dependent methyltransferase n=1 Tax=Auriscalpium vulgare TaxID=40419 RepID=A0ACB8S5J5_9AGAM|nr:S-adenosyl-L-methionine-dependent methyltransferase [Auriscalpium vulgare]
MTSDASSADTQSTYWHKANDDKEFERLDGLNIGLSKYLDGKLSLAPLENPQKILDLGAGSGYWAIQAATIHPTAEVLATDLSPLPNRPLPPNVSFRQLNILEPFPFDKESFDVVHTRFVLVHLPHPEQPLQRIIELIKPGGWLLVEDIAQHADVQGEVPGIRAAYTAMCSLWKSVGQNPGFAAELEARLNASALFSEVHVHKVVAPLNPPADAGLDPKVKIISETLRGSYNRSFSRPSPPTPEMVLHGYTAELQQKRGQEVDTPGWTFDQPLYFCWAKKKA